MTSQIVTARSALGKSLGSFISAMKLGSVICPMKVYEMFRKAFIPATKVTPLTGSAVTIGSPPWMPVTGSMKLGSGLYPAGWASIPAKIAAKRTEMNVKKADPVPNFDKALKVLGSENTQQMIVAMTAKTTVHSLWLVIVLRYLALVSTCRPYDILTKWKDEQVRSLT